MIKSSLSAAISTLLLLSSILAPGGFAFSSARATRLLGGRQSTIKVLPARTSRFRQFFSPKNLQFQLPNGNGTLLRTSSSDETAAASPMEPRKVPQFIYKLNASTKWLITLACTVGVWARIHRYEGPFVIIGSIMSVYFTEVLKKILNQSRPEGAPFADPGMPSSHSLLSFFLAVAWSTLAFPSSPVISGSLLSSAGIVALLRVICGYHSWAQIVVGSILGSGMGLAWAKLGSFVATHGHPTAVFRASWIVYLLGSVFYINKTMRPWLYEHKHL